MMISFSALDWIRTFICLFFLEGLIYLLFPKIIQKFAIRILCEASPRTLQLFGVFLLIIGFVLWVIASKSFATSSFSAFQ